MAFVVTLSKNIANLIYKLVSEMRKQDLEYISPHYTINGGIVYPFAIKALGVSDDLIQEVLETATELRILEKKITDNLILCPNCKSSKLRTWIACPMCGSRNFEKGIGIRHIECGFIAFREDFMKDDKLVCPHCKKELKQMSVDWAFTGIILQCKSCGTYIEHPEIGFECLECGREGPIRDSILSPIYGYFLSPKADIKKIVNDIDFSDSLIEVIQKSGWSVEKDVVMESPEGRKIKVHAVLKKGDISVVVKFIPSINPIGEEIISKAIEELLQLSPREALIIGIPGFTNSARLLMIAHGINFVGTNEIERIPQIISEKLLDIETELEMLPEEEENLRQFIDKK